VGVQVLACCSGISSLSATGTQATDKTVAAALTKCPNLAVLRLAGSCVRGLFARDFQATSGREKEVVAWNLQQVTLPILSASCMEDVSRFFANRETWLHGVTLVCATVK